MTQKEDILTALLAGEKLTPLDALEEFDCLSLAARVYDLRDEGYDVRAETIGHTTKGGKRKSYARYYMDAQPEQQELF
tara:strand:- start:71 stop:304 length:234 start_codon:yes stop_codon:yes gene_type:complete